MRDILIILHRTILLLVSALVLQDTWAEESPEAGSEVPPDPVALLHEGRYEEARGILDTAKHNARKKALMLGTKGQGLGRSAGQVDGMIKELQAAPSSPTRKKAFMKRSKGRAYKLKKK